MFRHRTARLLLLSSAWCIAVSTPVHAYEFRVRFVHRVGTTDTVLGGDRLNVGISTDPYRVRVQIGVFDDADGPAPLGGFVGWNIGAISVNNRREDSIDRRTNGRLAPFVFSNTQGANGNPPPAGGPSAGDAPGTDFQGWTDIDATLGTQPVEWGCDENGMPLPHPLPIVRGLNTYVSVYEITTQPQGGAGSYSITWSGNLIAALEWRGVGNPVPPDCGDPDDPNDDIPGQVVFAPFTAPPVSFSRSLQVVIPSPSAGALLLLGPFAWSRRRRP